MFKMTINLFFADFRKTVRGRLLNKLNTRNRIAKGENGNDGGKNDKKNTQIEVRNNQIDYRELMDVGNNILDSSYERYNKKAHIFGYTFIKKNLNPWVCMHFMLINYIF